MIFGSSRSTVATNFRRLTFREMMTPSSSIPKRWNECLPISIASVFRAMSYLLRTGRPRWPICGRRPSHKEWGVDGHLESLAYGGGKGNQTLVYSVKAKRKKKGSLGQAPPLFGWRGGYVTPSLT